MILLVLPLVFVQGVTDPQFHEYLSQSGGFRVSMPGVPVESPVVAADGTEQYRLMLDGYDGAYLVFYQDRPDLAGKTARARRIALAGVAQGLASMVKGRIVEQSGLKLEGKYMGLACVIELTEPPGLLRSRLYLVGERLYRLTAVGDGEFALSERADKFLGSFRLLPSAPN
jgi:hypothetical protein